ncbi:uncharacterized protein [Amphiura filiformis]|uniref:uncharacterized protein n=1 Tax=Amphiura filiformis TaxID=82378 RepID=UPI003B223647
MMEKRKILTPEELKEFENDKFPFENIAFEGGGSQGTAHIGAVRVLEEIGVWTNMKRFAGTSAGALVAMAGALGCDSHVMEKKMADGGLSKPLDACCCALLPNLLTHYGLHPGKKVEKWIGQVLKKRLGNANATFEDLYKKCNKRELCVVVSNLSQLDCLYCHVKTTPCMKIKDAVRMSLSHPGVLFPVKHKDQYFVDGGLTNNYPIRVFDGWYLSLKPQDNFLIRIPEFGDLAAAWDPNSQFGDQPNGKTIGVVLYSADEKEMFKEEFNRRAKEHAPNTTPEMPKKTELARERKQKMDRIDAAQQEHGDLVNAMTAFIKLLGKHADVEKGTVPKDAFKRALDQAGDEFTKEQKAIIFGEGKTNAQIVNAIDTDQDGQLSHREITKYAESRGIDARNVFRGFTGKEIKNLAGYFTTILDMVMLNSKRVLYKRDDLSRTIGVDTGYIDALDLELDEEDREYMLKQGKRGCMAFLRYYKSQRHVQQAWQAE